MLHPSGTKVLSGDNPFGVLHEHDYFLGAKPDIQFWNETWFFSSWSPSEEVGVFIHAGADPADPALFYAQVIIYLPGGELVVDRQWGRPKAGNLTICGCSITTEEPLRRWRLRYDGAGEKTTSEQSGRAPVGAGIAVPCNFDIEFTAAAPIWDMYKATDIPQLGWAGMHHEQTTHSRGSICVEKSAWQFDDGVGFRDHSTGQREVSNMGADRFWGIVSPTTKRSFQGLNYWDRAGELQMSSAAYFADGQFEIINGGIEVTGMSDTYGNPKDIEMSFTRPNGERIVGHGRIVHTVTNSVLDPNHNVNGTVVEGDPLILGESQIRVEWPDGDVFYGHLERLTRLVNLKLP